MDIDLFRFWSQIGDNEHVHPTDRDVLHRMGTTHGFALECLPSCFAGPLRRAKVVLLYLSPGFSESDREEAESPEGRIRATERRTGLQVLPGPKEHEPAWRWWRSRTSDFGDWENLRSRVAILNIGAYHSKTVPDASVLAALPSTRVVLEWAQTVLFPQAEAGKKVLVCLRAARIWGLDTGKAGMRHGKALYAPKTNRSGHMLKLPLREEVKNAVRAAIELV